MEALDRNGLLGCLNTISLFGTIKKIWMLEILAVSGKKYVVDIVKIAIHLKWHVELQKNIYLSLKTVKCILCFRSTQWFMFNISQLPKRQIKSRFYLLRAMNIKITDPSIFVAKGLHKKWKNEKLITWLRKHSYKSRINRTVNDS